ncbi:alpha/beta fold hydrolase [Streptomyces albiaxialis]|uniref:Alpha/beta fold hydrolase n=1 Tax=Streptomyces albiaxialis TaxID=329523 RepID=A0ABP5IQ96_9ACTN
MTRLVRPHRRPWASRRLVCMSYAGGGTTAFRPWAQQLPVDTELRILCYPGREARFGERAESWQALIEDAVTALTREVRGPYVLYGHSMGAMVAYATARRLQALGTPGPDSLILSGHIAPQHWTGTRTAALAEASDEELAARLGDLGGTAASVLSDPGMRSLAVGLLRSDLAAYAGFAYEPGERLSAGIQLLVGEQELSPMHEGWAELTEGPSSLDVLPGGHFFTPEVWRSLPRRMRAFGVHEEMAATRP